MLDKKTAISREWGGGLGRSSSGRSGSVTITYGECVIIFHEDMDDNSSDCTLWCGVGIVQTGKLCFKEYLAPACSTPTDIT